MATKTTTQSTSRREFLAGAAAGLTILSSARSVRSYAANERLNLAIFGTKYNAQHFLRTCHSYNVNIVALCDPDRRKIVKARETLKQMATRMETTRRTADRSWAERYQRMAENVSVYADIRRLFEERSDSIDALVVSNYDHFHGITCGQALRAGKPVCSERPIGMNISDARKLRSLAAETKIPVTYRSPGTGTGPFRRAMELVEDDAIGDVREVHIWNVRPGTDRTSLPKGPQPVPAELDWDLWLGPLASRDYHPDWMQYASWRELCSGDLGGVGAHSAIFPFLTLHFRRLWDQPAGQALIRVTAECSRLNQISFPLWERIRWEIPPRDEMPPVTMTWHKGPEYAPGGRELIHEYLRAFGIANSKDADELMGNLGSMLVGTRGALIGNGHSTQITALPRAKFEQIETDQPQRIGSTRGIRRDWIDACRGEKPEILANFDNGGPLSETLMLGEIATLYPSETLTYDPRAGHITGKDEANEQLAMQYRNGWTI